MPIDARIPLGVTGPDPAGFTNALAAGIKMRELQNASDRQAAKDEAAVAKTNALRKFWMSDRGPEAIRTLGIEAPDAVSAIEKNTREAELHEIEAKKAKLEWAKGNHELLSRGAAAIVANPTRETALMTIEAAERQGGDMTDARRQLENTPDHAIAKLGQSWGMNAQQIEQLAQKDREAARGRWNAYTGRYEPGAPGSAPTTAPTGPEPVRPGTVVPGGELPPQEDIEAERLYRAGQGPAPTGNVDFEGLSDAALDELQATSTFQKGQKPPALIPAEAGTPAAPVPSAPPMDGQPPPVYRSQAERDAARDQRQAAKDAEAQRAADARLDFERRRVEALERRKGETPAAAREHTQQIKNQQKFRDFQANMKQLTDAANALDADLVKRGTETDIPVFGSKGAAEQSTRYADVMAAIQRIRDMGVLQPGEFPFLEMAVKNPTTWWNGLRAEDIRGQLSVIKEQAGQALERAKTRFLPAPSTTPPAGGGATAHADTSPDPAKFQPMDERAELERLRALKAARGGS